MFRLLLGLTCILFVQAYQSATTTLEKEYLQAAFRNDVEGVQQALAQGVDPNVRDDRSGQTALMGSVLRGNDKMVQFLLDRRDVDVVVPEKDGYRPAHGAGFQGRAQILRLLYAKGIDIGSDMHEDGYLPLHRACWGREPRHAETVRAFHELGVNLATPARDGRTCAEMTGNSKTLEVLKELGFYAEEAEL